MATAAKQYILLITIRNKRLILPLAESFTACREDALLDLNFKNLHLGSLIVFNEIFLIHSTEILCVDDGDYNFLVIK